jgi:hypothetical protein
MPKSASECIIQHSKSADQQDARHYLHNFAMMEFPSTTSLPDRRTLIRPTSATFRRTHRRSRSALYAATGVPLFGVLRPPTKNQYARQ